MNISGEHIYGTNISGVNISGEHIYGTNISGVNISGNHIYGTSISGDNITGTLTGCTFPSGSICKIHIIPFTASASTPGAGTLNNYSTEYFSKVFTKTKNTVLFGEITIDYEIGGFGPDKFESRLRIADGVYNNASAFEYHGAGYHQIYDGATPATAGGGTRSSSLTDCVVYTGSGGSGFEGLLYISFQVKTNPADDDIIVNHGCYKITELWQ